MSPYYTNYRFYPPNIWPVEMESKNPKSKNYAHWILCVLNLCNTYLKKTSQTIGRYLDKSKNIAPPFKSCNLVMSNGKIVRTRRAANPRDAKLFTLFKVVKLVD